MIKTWVIYTLMFGYPMPTLDEATFTNESACQIYIHTKYTSDIQTAFKLYCNYTGPLICQGKPCE